MSLLGENDTGRPVVCVWMRISGVIDFVHVGNPLLLELLKFDYPAPWLQNVVDIDAIFRQSADDFLLLLVTGFVDAIAFSRNVMS